jgi:dihydrofolate reductase
MTTTTYYTATSLDGFIADEQNSLEWLFRQEQEENGPLNYDEFFSRIGAVVMGSTTYEWILQYENGAWPYKLPAWVMSTRDLPKVEGDIRFASGDVRPVHDHGVHGLGKAMTLAMSE